MSRNSTEESGLRTSAFRASALSSHLEHMPAFQVQANQLQSADSFRSSCSNSTGPLEAIDDITKTAVTQQRVTSSKPPTAVRRKGGRRKRKTAEEKAASVRARNRRAQQAFRKRQKVLSQERETSMATLHDEVESLKEMNYALSKTVEELTHRLREREALLAQAPYAPPGFTPHSMMPLEPLDMDTCLIPSSSLGADLPLLCDDLHHFDVKPCHSCPSSMTEGQF